MNGTGQGRGATPALCDVRWSAGDVAAVHRQRPDDQHVQGDDDQAPDRVVGQPYEVQHGAERGDGDADGAGPDGAVEDEEPGDQDEQADEQVDPAPGGQVELEDPFLADDVEVVVEQGDQALHRVERADHDHRDAGEDDESDGEAAARPFTGGCGHTQLPVDGDLSAEMSAGSTPGGKCGRTVSVSGSPAVPLTGESARVRRTGEHGHTAARALRENG